MPAAKGTEGIAASFADAQRHVRRRQAPKDPRQGQGMDFKGEMVLPNQWEHLADQWGMPPDSPVHVLGMEGDVLYVIDALGQLAGITDHAFGQNKVQRLFAHRIGYLYWAFPRIGNGGKISGFDTVAVRDAFYRAAGLKGLWSASNRVRGLGGWTDKAGNFVYHSGEVIFVKGREQPTGDYEGQFYPRRPAIPEPWSKPVSDEMLMETKLIDALRSFTFERGDVDPILVLGWLAAAFLGAALPWRPMLFVVGDRGVGKSSLQALVKGVLGEALHATADTTPAGIYQRVGQDSLPVAVDELEAGADNTRVRGIVALARLASSGAVQFRGGSNHVGTSFTAKNCFFMSAINMPPVPSQDLSRMALVHLKPREHSRAAEKLPVIQTEVVGRMMLRRLMDRWHLFEETYAAYRAALGTGGHDGRGQDTFGTLLACADLLLGDALLEEIGMPSMDGGLNRWGELLAPSSLPEHEDAAENWRRCLVHLLTARVDAWRSGLQHTVGQLMDELDAGVVNLKDANDRLAMMDLRAGPASEVISTQSDGYILYVPNSSQMVAQIFKGEAWGGDGSTGVWSGALRQGEYTGAVIKSKGVNKKRINGSERRCTLINMKIFNGVSK